MLNKYFPPDFDPKKVPRMKRDLEKQIGVRMMIPFSLQCNTCGEFMYRCDAWMLNIGCGSGIRCGECERDLLHYMTLILRVGSSEPAGCNGASEPAMVCALYGQDRATRLPGNQVRQGQTKGGSGSLSYTWHRIPWYSFTTPQQQVRSRCGGCR